jgi:hypothetical protein
MLVLWAFWSSFFSRLFTSGDSYIQMHALAQTSWCVLLLIQACVIRVKQVGIHRQLGAVSPVLAVVMIGSTLMLMQHRIPDPPLMDWYLKATAFNIATLVAFALVYCLALYRRDDPNLHSAYMICTVLPFFTAFGPRLIEKSNLLVGLSMSMFGSFVALGQASLIPADLMAAALSIWDWRSNRRLTVFPVVLASLLAIHTAPIALYRVPIWKSTVEMFATVR